MNLFSETCKRIQPLLARDVGRKEEPRHVESGPSSWRHRPSQPKIFFETERSDSALRVCSEFRAPRAFSSEDFKLSFPSNLCACAETYLNSGAVGAVSRSSHNAAAAALFSGVASCSSHDATAAADKHAPRCCLLASGVFALP